MGFKVVKRFRETKHDNRTYEVGEEYPAKGYKPAKGRVDVLSSTKNKYQSVFIEEVKTPKKDKE